MRIIFDFIVSFWDTTENALVNWIIVGLMAPIAFDIAYRITGNMRLHHATTMRIVHWTIRFFTYIVLTYILKSMIWLLTQPLSLFNTNEPRLTSAIFVSLALLVYALWIKNTSHVRHKLFWS